MKHTFAAIVEAGMVRLEAVDDVALGKPVQGVGLIGIIGFNRV
jgi:hypothetical protein